MTERDWTPLFQAFAEALEWVLDRAQQFARDYPDEVAAVERVRTFVKKRIAGDPAHVRVDDLLFTFGLIAGAIEQRRVVAVAPGPRKGLLRRPRVTAAKARGTVRA